MDWFKVMANYEDDLAIQEAGERGEVLFFRGLAYCARSNSDGFIPATQLQRFGLPRVSSRVTSLVATGLWDVVHRDGKAGWQVRNWHLVQSAAYAAERKRIKDANRAASKRAVESRSHIDSRTTVVPLEENRRTTPHPPAQQGGHDGTHQNCRDCRTSRRQQAKIARTWKPPWCGVCDEGTRLSGYDGPAPARCVSCHPLAVAVADEPESA